MLNNREIASLFWLRLITVALEFLWSASDSANP